MELERKKGCPLEGKGRTKGRKKQGKQKERIGTLSFVWKVS
jgi:hypothetical protein